MVGDGERRQRSASQLAEPTSLQKWALLALHGRAAVTDDRASNLRFEAEREKIILFANQSMRSLESMLRMLSARRLS